MSGAETKSRAGGARQEVGENDLYLDSVNNNNDFVNRLYDRVAKIIADRCAPVQLGGLTFPSSPKPTEVLAELEHNAITVLASEIRCYPEIAEVLPESFRQAVLSGYPENLTNLERAALILATDETPATTDYDDHFAMKVYSLVFALRGGGEL
ncbi:MAG: hypothetical protein ACYC1H_02520 [Rectinema subterraneum]